jgi:Fe2+ transport system protein B
VVFIVNKYDLRGQASFELDEIKIIAEKFNAPYFITSAKTGENVESAFYDLSELMVKHKVESKTEKENEVSKVASEIIIEFSNKIGGIERGIPLVKEIFKAAGVDFLNPQKEQLIKALPDLVQLVRDLKSSDIADQASNNFDRIIGKLN